MSKKIQADYADENQKNLYKKFPSTHFLSKPDNVDHVLLWSTFFRRNLHRLAIDYFGIKLHFYQAVLLYLMGISRMIVVIACRAAAKSWLVAVFLCCWNTLYPNSPIILVSGTKGQAKLIVSTKIKKELMGSSYMLRQEIDNIKDNQNEIIVFFKNNSTITVVPASENARGHRSTVAVREEYRQIDKSVDDSIISPFQIVRQAPYMLLEPYSAMKELREEPVDVYISSSWYDGHWMWNVADQAFADMLNDGDSCFLAFDESVVLKHGIKTEKQLARERKKQDPLTWRIEFLNERLKQNASAFFPYNIIIQNQVLKQPFYPRSIEDYKSRKKNLYFIPKQEGEVRIISCDFAFISGTANDNSAFSCIRALPEIVTHFDDENNNRAIVKQGYRRLVPYIEAHPGGDVVKQAVRIRQLYEDFQADYLILDIKNAGISIYHLLAKTLYDDERSIEYNPFVCMNDDDLAKEIQVPGAKPVVYAITATQKLNSKIAFELRTCLMDKNISFLINLSQAKEEVLMENKEYKELLDSDQSVMFEMPFIETQLFVHETSALLYEKLEQTGGVKIYEQPSQRKDRYTSVSYGNYFISELEKDLFNNSISTQNSDMAYIASLISAPQIRGWKGR